VHEARLMQPQTHAARHALGKSEQSRFLLRGREIEPIPG
jgi:hypothetical protein